MSYNLVDPTTGDLTRVAGNSNIVDTAIEIDSTWSSKKINDSLVNIADKLEKNVKFDVDDLNTAYVPNKTITVRTNKNTKNLPPSSMVNFLVTSFAYVEGQYYRITQYCYENSENLSYSMYVRRGVSNAGESSITWTSWEQLATMDKAFKYSGVIEANTTSGYIQTNNPLGVECNIICSKMYVSGLQPNGLSVTGQTTYEKINIYVRNADGTIPPDGTNIKIAFILF